MKKEDTIYKNKTVLKTLRSTGDLTKQTETVTDSK